MARELHDMQAHLADLASSGGESLLWLGDAIPGGFFVYRADETLEIVYANQETFNIFGCANREEFDELTGGTFLGMVHPEDYAAIQESIDYQIADAANENFDRVEYRITRKDGEVRWVDDYGRFARIPVHGDVYYVFISDVTDKKRALEEKQRTELALAHELQANEAKSAFLFSLSHDIRTPMNAVVGYSELAKRHIHEPDLLEGYLDRAVTASSQLLRLIDDMLEMNRIGVGAVEAEPEPVRLRRQLEMVADLFRIPAGEKDVDFQVDLALGDEEVLLDQNSFRRIIGNLLDNAVKFTPAGGAVSLSATGSAGPEPGFLDCTIAIADTGKGMTQEFMDRMYGAFEREQSATQSGLVGTGLGLTIVKRLVTMMDGAIAAESAVGKGTTFTLQLPLQLVKADADFPVSDGLPLGPMRGRRILVVDDIDINRDLACELLQEEGFVAESVDDGYQAVEAVKNHPVRYYDLVLMDIQMPIMDGYESTKAIRALPREDAAWLPIVALSANARPEDVGRSLESGMNAHVAKPFELDELVGVIVGQIRAAHDGLATRRAGNIVKGVDAS